MKIGIIGAGKVGFSLGRFLAHGGIQITGYYSRSQESAKEAGAFTDSGYFCSLKDLVKESDAIFITVPDSAIRDVFLELCTFEIKNKYICHCSGALSVKDAFPGIEDRGAFGVSVHPLFPISSKYASYGELQDAFFCLEGNEKAAAAFEGILKGLGVRTQRIAPENKVLYHAGCVIAGNFMCALAMEAIELLCMCGFSEEGAKDALSPLMEANLSHILEDGPVKALTGPAERADTVTVSKHLDALADPDANKLYRLLSLKLAQMAGQKHPNKDYGGLIGLLTDSEEDRS